MLITRRRFHALFSAGLLGPAALLGRRALAAGGQRRFIFIFCQGGWDHAVVFAPTFDNAAIPDEEGAELGEAGGLSFVDHPDRPSVRSFLEAWADRTAFLNGFEVPSISHERCRQLLMTGGTQAAADDWPAILAGHAAGSPLLPCLVVSGPSFSSRYAPSVIRIGERGQISGLVDGSALRASQIAVPSAVTELDGLLDAYVQGRVEARLAAAGPGRERRFMEHYSGAMEDLGDLWDLAGQVDLQVDDEGTLPERLVPVLDLFQAGLSRTATVSFLGANREGFDTHSGNGRQSDHFEWLFRELEDLMADLEARPGPAGGTLADEVVLVVCSEMGRSPLLNSQDGKDHWTYTSAMLVGPGVRGGLVAGGFDDDGLGRPTALSTGEPSDKGVALTSAHLGATVLALGGVDPGDYLEGIDPVSALLL
jgi:uncharacterized protein (DUF1501 family)